ncbi:thiamine pyrophosphate-dependent enzyme [Acetobacterium bakii]|uniref:2-oxoacid ferredoxin oxidoreductase n=1 Tax=Acetobacterium bakii TaxID=52689 RepID=A0A0L6U025_9FIRM|nr:thiamine pyrophosphate-dependent enzyme [Acetobacterium bakii]KNZ41833.1 2-oxoacid ferredoxin oxidoreductase [Acetobacterium bakii]
MNNQFVSSETAWCPGCGNFSIIDTLVGVLNELDLSPHKVVLVGGIGQAAKTNQYVSANGFSGLHGRSIPAAVAIKLVNDDLTVIVNTGDGDSYGEGGNHFIHNIRRNVDITHFVHDNQIYGLTKGQTSPTSDACQLDHKTSACNLSTPFNPLLVAIACGATFVARSFTGRKDHLAMVMAAAIRHKGYALVDILQPCVSFNKVNTHSFYDKRVQELDASYDSSNKMAAIEKTMEFGDTIPIGILYQEKGLTYEDKHPQLFNDVPVIHKAHNMDDINELFKDFI